MAAQNHRFFWPIFQISILFSWRGSMALRIILLEPGYLTTDVINVTLQPSVDMEVPVNWQNVSRGCQYYDENAADLLGNYFFNNTVNYVGQTYLVVLECENVALIATTFGQEFDLPLITSTWKAQTTSQSNLRIDYRSLVLNPFFDGVELFMRSYRLYSVVVICQDDENDPHLYYLCDQSLLLFSKNVSVKRIYMNGSISSEFGLTIRQVHLSGRVLLLLLPLYQQRRFLVEASQTELWAGNYVFLCTNFDGVASELFAPFTPTENEDQAPPLPLFMIRLVYQDDQAAVIEQILQFGVNLTRANNLTIAFDIVELRELFTLQKVMALVGQMNLSNSDLNATGTADLLPLLVGAEPVITDVVFDKVMPDTSVQTFASYSPQASGIYASLFDPSIFDSWWPNDNFPPADLPACINCPNERVDESLMAVVVIPILLIIIPLVMIAVRRRNEKNVKNGNSGDAAASTETSEFDSWNIKLEELSPFGRAAASKSVLSVGSQNSHTQPHQVHAKEAMRYKQVVVWVSMRELTYFYVPDQNQIQYVIKVKNLTHANLVTFYGLLLSTDPLNSEMGIIVEYCSKGSLYDLIAEEQNRFNPALTSMLIKDIVTGMTFLHQSLLFCHGSLKSPNCLITSRFNAKITDYYLRATPILPPALATDETQYSKMLWTAPEILRGPLIRLRKGTKEGDVYSFGIILQEITMQSEPFRLGEAEHDDTNLNPKQIVHSVIQERDEPFRPQLLSKYCGSELQQLIKRCWAEKPIERPTFKIIGDYIAHIPGFDKGSSYLDYVLKRMENYSNQLEARVAETTSGLLEEKQKSDDLLAQMMPRSVMEQMQKGQVVLPESFEYVTLGFTAVIDFALIAYSSTPLQIVVFLNGLYSMFDNALESYDLYKVETIQDSYVIASGLPNRNGNEHARQVSLVALHMLKDISTVRFEHLKNTPVQMKIGIHTGTCAAGVIGQKAPRYCIFGDTVNTTSRMCTTGEAQRTQISEITKTFLEQYYPGEFVITSRGTIQVKGKGEMNTYYLDARP